MNTEVMFSSKTDSWATPTDFFRELDEEFHFNLDPCADEYNHKCDRYFTVKEDGLSQEWGGGIASFVIPLMAAKLGSGLKKHIARIRNTGILLLCCYQPGLVRNGSMILYTTKRKSVLYAAA